MPEIRTVVTFTKTEIVSLLTEYARKQTGIQEGSAHVEYQSVLDADGNDKPGEYQFQVKLQAKNQKLSR